MHKAVRLPSLDVTWLQPFGHAIHHKCPWRRRSWNCILSHITERTLSNHTLKSRLLCPCFPKRFFTSSSTRMPSQRRRSRRFGEALHTTCDGAACKHTEVRANGLPSKTAEFLPCNCACRHGAWVYHNGFWMLLAVSALKLAWRSLKWELGYGITYVPTYIALIIPLPRGHECRPFGSSHYSCRSPRKEHSCRSCDPVVVSKDNSTHYLQEAYIG